jgi:2-desacetyl-2-hydroxyethyl bacteriochlorophyllide A dehydrogenase
MKRLLITGPRQAAFEDVGMPSCEPDGIVVRAIVTTISSGTEVRVYRAKAVDEEGRYMHANVPYEIPCDNGYSMVGEVVEVGADVSDLQVGERVFVPMPHKEYAAVNASNAIKLPGSIPDEEAVMLSILGVAHQGFRQGAPPAGGNLAVVGQGVIGLSITAFAQAFGMRTAVLDTDPTRLDIARAMGVRLAIDPREGGAVEQVINLFDGDGADVTCEAASNWSGVRTAMDVTRKDGTVVIVSRNTQHPNFNPVGNPFLEKRLQLVTSYAFPSDDARWSKARSHSLTLDLMERRQLNVASILTHTFSWEELPEVYKRLDDGDRSIVGTTIRW